MCFTLTLFATQAAVAQDAANLLNPGLLGGEARHLAFLSTDKPIYKPGETMYLRAVSLTADGFFPLKENGSAEIQIRGPKGEIVQTLRTSLQNSTAGFAWKLPDGIAGGRYTAVATVTVYPTEPRQVTNPPTKSAPAERNFEIRVYTPPRLKSQIQFIREGYGPGDSVMASVNVSRAEGGFPTGAEVVAVARVDGNEIVRIEGLTIDENGNCSTSFDLPKEIEIGDGTLAFIIADGGLQETASKTIPILLQTMDIRFYPESGDMIAGLEGRVYVQANRPDGKPADLEGAIISVDTDGNVIPNVEVAANLTTAHEGRGIFTFTPVKDQRYALRIERPSGITRLFPLPAVKTTGAIMTAQKETFPFNEKIRLKIANTADAPIMKITLAQREKVLQEALVADIVDGIVSFDAKEAEGVLIVTLWGRNNQPLAERLVFRQPKFNANIKITAENAKDAKASLTPGGRVKLVIEASGNEGEPIEATVGLAVVNDALLEMQETRDQPPSLPVMVRLENEVQDLADAHVYFDPKNENASRDIDLLLGTQGWRRFILVKLDDLLKSHREASTRALAIVQRTSWDGLTYLRRSTADVIIGGESVPGPLSSTTVRNSARRDFETDGRLPQAMGMDMKVEDAAMPSIELTQQLQPRSDDLPAVGMNIPPRDDLPAVGMNIPPRFASGPEPLPLPQLVESEDRDISEWGDGSERRFRPLTTSTPHPSITLPRPAPAPRYVLVREYAHTVRPNRKPNDRVDFTETLYWNAGLRTNPRDGKVTVEFDLSDSVTSFRILADAFGNNGALGASRSDINSVEPFYAEPKLPVQAVIGDTITIPVVLVNSTTTDLGRPNVIITAEGLDISTPVLPATLAANTRERAEVTVKVTRPGTYDLVINAAAGGYADKVTRKITVLPRGFPVTESVSGLISSDKPLNRKISIARGVSMGSMKIDAKVYSTPIANMEDALAALLRAPHGCFEQTSSTNYPVVMVQQYFLLHDGISPARIKQGSDLLTQGYQKLIGFETKTKGYEWFGKDPGNEALTAYGLMQFTEMAKVGAVDSAMMLRTREWLMSRADGAGGFRQSMSGTFGQAPKPVNDLYIIWSLLESGESPAKLAREIENAKKIAQETKDPYLQALGVNILFLSNDLPAARTIAKKLQESVGKDGGIDGAATSITRSGGIGLRIETTSLAVLGWLRLGDEFVMTVETSMKWLFESCKAGRFGSTQSTILALKAINAYDKARAKPKAPGSIQLMIDGKPFGAAIAFDTKTQGSLELPDFTAALVPGTDHELGLVMTDGSEMPFSISIAYNTPQPANAPECEVKVTTRLSTAQIAEGEPLDLHLEVTAEKDVPSMVTAIIGLPGGTEPRYERLKELMAAERIASYEMFGRELVLYWRSLKAGDKMAIDIPLIAEVPGQYTSPAARVYQYYTEEYKHWAPEMELTIAAAKR